MEDITDWGQYMFSVKRNFVLKLPQFKVSTDHPLGFGNPEDVERWVSKNHVIRILAQPKDTSSVASIGASLRPIPPGG
jgi:hypothetical protein